MLFRSPSNDPRSQTLMRNSKQHVSSDFRPETKGRAHRRFGPAWVAGILALAAILGIFSGDIPSIRTFTMPRFGWIGLSLCFFPLLTLLPYLWAPKRSTLMDSAHMTCVLAVINGALLVWNGTVAVVSKEFTDRLHSSWLWSVLPLLLLAAYLYWFATHAFPIALDKREQDSTSRK